MNIANFVIAFGWVVINQVTAAYEDVDDIINTIDNKTSWIQDDNKRKLIRDYMIFCPNQDMCLGPEMTIDVLMNRTMKASCSTCSCSKDCSRFSTCCPTKELVDTSSNDSENMKKSSLTCTTAEIKGPFFNDKRTTKYWMIAGCPPNYPKNNIFTNCGSEIPFSTTLKNISLYRPVTSAVTNETYKNIYCALCHGENRHAIFTWKMFVKTDQVQNAISELGRSDEELFDLMTSQDSNHSLVFRPSGSYKDNVETCYTDYVSACNVSGQWSDYDEIVLEACQQRAFISLFTDCTSVYKNVYCAICNKDKPYHSLNHHCLKEVLEYTELSKISSVNLRLSLPMVENVEYRQSKKCASDEIYDPSKRICLEIVCERGFVRVGPKCQPVVNEVNHATYIFNGILCNNETLTFGNHVPTYLRDGYVCNTCFEEEVPLSVKNDIWKTCFPFTMWYNVLQSHQILFMIEQLYRKHESLLGGAHRTYTGNHPNFTILINNQRFDNPISVMHFPRDECAACSKYPVLSFALTPWQICPRVLIESSRMYFINKDLLFCFKEYDACISHSFVRVSDDRYYFGVCITQYLEAIRSTYIGVTTDTKEEYVFIVCLLISLLMCLLHIISTAYLTEKWTSIVLSEMAQSLTYLIMNFIQILIGLVFLGEAACGVFGMVIHFLFLFVAGWSSVASIDLARSIFIQIRSGVEDQLKPIRFATYFPINLIFCCICIVCNTVPNMDAEDSLLGYSTSTCEILTTEMSVYTLGIPLTLFLFLDLVSIIWVFFQTYGADGAMSCPKAKSIKSFLVVMIFIWLQWFFYYLVAVSRISIFVSLKTLSTALVGIFIFIGFSPAFSDA